MKEILLRRCESNNTDYYSLQGTDCVFTLHLHNDIVYVYAFGKLILTIGNTNRLTDLINLVN